MPGSVGVVDAGVNGASPLDIKVASDIRGTVVEGDQVKTPSQQHESRVISTQISKGVGLHVDIGV